MCIYPVFMTAERERDTERERESSRLIGRNRRS